MSRSQKQTHVDCPESYGIYPETDSDPLVRKAQATAAVHAVLADLDRRWKVPPTEFCAELASQIVAQIALNPALMGGLVRTWMAIVRGQAMFDELTRLGLNVRMDHGMILVGPKDKVTKEITDRINAGKADLLAALGG